LGMVECQILCGNESGQNRNGSILAHVPRMKANPNSPRPSQSLRACHPQWFKLRASVWHAQTNGMGVVASVQPIPTPFAKPQGVPPDPKSCVKTSIRSLAKGARRNGTTRRLNDQ
jgi:hypothetical protein